AAGAPPYEGAGPTALLRAHAGPQPAALAPQAIMRMIAADPGARPQSMAEALGEAAGPEPSLLTSRFSGREALLAAFAEQARGPADRTLWVAGPAGSGKTRFLEECRVTAQLAGLPIFAGQADRHGSPYGAMASVARALLAGAPELLDALPPEPRASLGRLLPDLGGQAERTGMEPRDERVALQSAIAELIVRAAGPRGAVLALDDWDLADAGSRETLAYLRRNAHGVPFLVVLTAAEADAPDAWRLEPLDVQGVAQVTASVLGGASLPDAFAAALLRWTGGQPGAVLHALEHLARTGALRDGLPEGSRLEQLGEELRATLRAPLAGLRGAAVQAAEALAVAGADADLPMLAALAGLEEEPLFAALYELQARHVVQLRGDRPAFAALALEEAVYGGVDAARRMALHAAVADQLELRLRARSADAASQTSLARHFLRSRQLDRALSAAFLAADFNMDVFAVDVARTLLRDGLALMDEQPGQHDHWRCAFLGRLAMVERWRGDFMAMGACLDQAIPLAERLRENETLCRLLVLQGAYFNQQMTNASFRGAVDVLQRATRIMASGSLVTQTRCRFYLGQANFYLGRTAEARASFEEAVRLAKRANLPFWEAKSLAFVGYLETVSGLARREAGFAKLSAAAEIQARLGDRYGAAFTAALQGEALAKALRLAEAEAAYEAQVAANDELGVVEDLVAGLTNLAHVRALAGRFAQARDTCRQAVELAARTDQPVGQLARALEGWITACRGDLAEAETLLAASDETSGYMFTHSAPVLLAGWLRLGRLDEVRRLGQEALFALRASPDLDLLAQVLALLGEAHVRLGELDTGSDYAARAWEAASLDHPLARYLALRTRTSLALARGDADAALAAAEEGLALARAAGAGVFVAESEGQVGQALLAAGRPGADERFQAMQAFAEAQGVPYMRALALHGRSLAAPGPEPWVQAAREALLALAQGLSPATRHAFLQVREVAHVMDDRAPRRLDEVVPALLRRLAGLGSLAEVAREVALAALEVSGAERAGIWIDGRCVAWCNSRGAQESPGLPPAGPGAPLVAGGKAFGSLHVEGGEPAALAPLADQLGMAIAYARSLPG
ncbi:MAG: pknB11, partial [Cyanobacteria bacterium RYN_339]|nr:pknB11 [Cyanobacteria bacterium RYN_339]